MGSDEDQLEIGTRLPKGMGRTVLDADNSWFTLLSMHRSPSHLNADYVAQSRLREYTNPEGGNFNCILNSGVTLGLLTGLSNLPIEHLIWRTLGWREVKLLLPVFAGDTLYAESVVIERDRDGGGATLETTGLNQRGDVVARMVRDISLLPEDGLEAKSGGSTVEGESSTPPSLVEPDFKGDWAFEDFTIGRKIVHPHVRTVLDVDALWYPILTMNRLRAYSRPNEEGRWECDPVLVAMLLLGVSSAQTSEPHGLLNLAWKDIQVLGPLCVGDTLYAESEVLDTRESASRPYGGIVTTRLFGYTQTGRTVMEQTRTFMVFKLEDSPKRHPYIPSRQRSQE